MWKEREREGGERRQLEIRRPPPLRKLVFMKYFGYEPAGNNKNNFSLFVAIIKYR